MPKKKAKKIDFRNHEFTWAQGVVRHDGTVEGFPSKEIETHDDYFGGKRWRFNIRQQDFMFVAPRTVSELNNRSILCLSEEEDFLVCNWLIKHGYADDRILPPPKR